jgi:hypothetical protein
VWFKWTPTTSAPIIADTANSNEDTVLFVYEGHKLVGCNDDTNGLSCGVTFRCSQVTFDAVAGKTYYFEIGSFDSGSGGTVNLNLAING